MITRPDQFKTRLSLPTIRTTEYSKVGQVNDPLTTMARAGQALNAFALHTRNLAISSNDDICNIRLPSPNPGLGATNVERQLANYDHIANINLVEIRLQNERIIGALENIERMIARKLD